MSHSPLETAILFHLGIVPVSRTVVTTWGLDCGADRRELDCDAEVSRRRGWMAGDDRNRCARNRRADRWRC